MGKVLWHITTSLGGFIAGSGDDMGWMADYFRPSPTVDEFLGQIGAALIGARTYQEPKTEEDKVYEGAWTGPQFVLTHAGADRAAPGFTFVHGDIEGAVSKARAAAGDRYVVILGASTAKQVLDAGLLDEILIHSVPVLLGDGVKMFNHRGGTKVRLEQISLTQAGSLTNLWPRVLHLRGGAMLT
jgi:dihydrofolate reductase